MLTKLQIRVIDAINFLRDNQLEMGAIALYRALGGDQSEQEFDAIAEACRDLESQGFVRELRIDSQNIVDHVFPNYSAISFREIQRLERKERWKERIIGSLICISVEVIVFIIIRTLTK